MDQQTKTILKEIISLFSFDIIYDIKKFRAVLRDYCAPKIDINLLVEIISSTAFKLFITDIIEKNEFNDYKRLKLLNDLACDYPIKKDALEEGVNAFLFAFGLYSSKDNIENDDAENILIAKVIREMLLEF